MREKLASNKQAQKTIVRFTAFYAKNSFGIVSAK
jgi:hypothetical protein